MLIKLFGMEFSENDLAVIALILDEEEEKQLKKKRKWVHEAWKKREIEGEFNTLYKELVDDQTKFVQYFRMTESCFNILHDKIEIYLKKKNTHWRKSITSKQRLAVCLR